MNDLVQRDGVFYEKFSDTPFTGTTTGKLQISFKNGRRHGVAATYNRRGQRIDTGTYSRGLQHGVSQVYHDNGQFAEMATWGFGRATGSYSRWYENGQLKSKGTLEGGTREGRWVDFNEDGKPDLKKTGTYQMDVRTGP